MDKETSEDFNQRESPQKVDMTILYDASVYLICSHRNLQKKKKKARYEREKLYMENIRGAGCAVGEYVGEGQGESGVQEPTSVDLDVVGAEPEVDDQVEDDDEDGSDNAQPLLIFYDCESTGLSIYNDYLTDVAAKVVNCPVPLNSPTFSSLVKTSRHIPAAGEAITCKMCTL